MSFKSYCWSVGTTSFRVKQLNYKIEKQLQMLKRLYVENPTGKWDVELQHKYYKVMLAEHFVEGMPNRPDKDARQKTSGLADIGVIDRGRQITDIGKKILDFTENINYAANNILGISTDSYVYLTQLLKFQVTTNSGTAVDDSITIKPFLALIHMLVKLDYLTFDEFTYLLPVCKSFIEVQRMINLIKDSRNRNLEIDLENIIKDKILEMDNYKEALSEFIEADILDEHLFMKIGMNRKSPSYDAGFSNVFSRFFLLHEVLKNDQEKEIIKHIQLTIKSLDSINTNQSKMWKRYFKFAGLKKINLDLINNLKNKEIFKSKNINEFKTNFFILLHLFKWQLTLLDYNDLNKRYFNLTDIIKFSNKVELTITAKYYFEEISEDLIGEEILGSEDYFSLFYKYTELEDISPIFHSDIDILQKKIHQSTGIDLPGDQIEDYFEDIKNKEFLELIDTKFTKHIIIDLLKAFIIRDDEKIYSIITENATPSTSFEYILGIIWYNLSDRKGRILDFLRLSLDANYLPKTHAAGGNADIIFKYEQSEAYPRHDLLIEATLSESGGQRQLEMEPVTRHLTRHLQENESEKDYVLFIANKLYRELVLDFRNRKSIYYETRSNREMQGMKIIPIDINTLIEIINREYNYKELYQIFDNAYKSTVSDLIWHKEEILGRILK